MNFMTAWNYSSLHGLELLEAQEDWLIQLTDTLGNCLHHHNQQAEHVISECLSLLNDGLTQTLYQEERAFAEMGRQIDLLHRTAHLQLQLVVETLSERHARGEAIGEHLLRQLQDWVLEHCGQFHTETLN